MARWVCVYPFPRNYGYPFGIVKPAQIVEHPVKPYPDAFERLADDDDRVESDAPKRRGRPPRESAVVSHVDAHRREADEVAPEVAPEPVEEQATPEDEA